MTDSIESVLQENRKFPPSAEFSVDAHISSEEQYQEMWQKAKDDPAAFWGEMAENLDWFKKWDSVLDGDMPNTKWFQGGKINASYQCLDRHVDSWRKNKAGWVALAFLSRSSTGEDGGTQMMDCLVSETVRIHGKRKVCHWLSSAFAHPSNAIVTGSSRLCSVRGRTTEPRMKFAPGSEPLTQSSASIHARSGACLCRRC